MQKSKCWHFRCGRFLARLRVRGSDVLSWRGGTRSTTGQGRTLLPRQLGAVCDSGQELLRPPLVQVNGHEVLQPGVGVLLHVLHRPRPTSASWATAQLLLHLLPSFRNKPDVFLMGQRIGLLGSLKGWRCGRGPPAIHPIEHKPWPRTTAGGGSRESWAARATPPGTRGPAGLLAFLGSGAPPPLGGPPWLRGARPRSPGASESAAWSSCDPGAGPLPPHSGSATVPRGQRGRGVRVHPARPPSTPPGAR